LDPGGRCGRKPGREAKAFWGGKVIVSSDRGGIRKGLLPRDAYCVFAGGSRLKFRGPEGKGGATKSGPRAGGGGEAKALAGVPLQKKKREQPGGCS